MKQMAWNIRRYQLKIMERGMVYVVDDGNATDQN
jgi:hypothetical protein